MSTLRLPVMAHRVTGRTTAPSLILLLSSLARRRAKRRELSADY